MNNKTYWKGNFPIPHFKNVIKILLKLFLKSNYMSQILYNYLPKDLVLMCQDYLLPSIFDTYTAKIEVGEEIRKYALNFKKENELYDFYINYYRGEICISAMLLKPPDL